MPEGKRQIRNLDAGDYVSIRFLKWTLEILSEKGWTPASGDVFTQLAQFAPHSDRLPHEAGACALHAADAQATIAALACSLER